MRHSPEPVIQRDLFGSRLCLDMENLENREKANAGGPLDFARRTPLAPDPQEIASHHNDPLI